MRDFVSSLLQHFICLDNHILHLFGELFELFHRFADALAVVGGQLHALNGVACRGDQAVDCGVKALDCLIDIVNRGTDFLVIFTRAADGGFGVVGEFADIGRHDRKTPSSFASPRRFDRGVE